MQIFVRVTEVVDQCHLYTCAKKVLLPYLFVIVMHQLIDADNCCCFKLIFIQ